MKKDIFCLCLLFLPLQFYGQDPLEIMHKSFLKCQSIQTGYYEVTQYLKFIEHSDTLKNTIRCYFRKMPDDINYGCAFHYYRLNNGKDFGEVMYTGKDLVRTYPPDSTAEIIEVSKWTDEIKMIKSNHIFYLYKPLTDKNCFPFMNEQGLVKDIFKLRIINEENVNGVSCFHIQVKQDPKTFSNLFLNQINQEYDYWINKQSFIPVQYTDLSNSIINKDTVEQFFKFYLNQVDVTNSEIDINLSLNSIPRYYKVKTYEAYKSPPALLKEVMAPDWSLVSLSDKTIKLSDLKGKLVLIDFFYKSCYPCMLSMPKLEALWEKFKDEGLIVIGIDPIDKNREELKDFIKRKGATYEILLSESDVPKAYHVSGYPTLYLINTEGKIVYSIAGFGQGMENYLEMVIQKAIFN